jgi:hypothetical protein
LISRIEEIKLSRKEETLKSRIEVILISWFQERQKERYQEYFISLFLDKNNSSFEGTKISWFLGFKDRLPQTTCCVNTYVLSVSAAVLTRRAQGRYPAAGDS